MTNEKPCDCWQEIKWLKSAVEHLQFKVELQYQLIQEVKGIKTQLPLITSLPDAYQSKLLNKESDISGIKNVFKDGQSLPEPIITVDETTSSSYSSVETNLGQVDNEVIQYPVCKIWEKENDNLAYISNNAQPIATVKDVSAYHPSTIEFSKSTKTKEHHDLLASRKTKQKLAAKLRRKRSSLTDLRKPILHCDQCEKVYTSKQGLDTHVNVVHKNIRYSCKHCPVSFRRYSGLRNHVNLHARNGGLEVQMLKQRLVVCQFCGENFNQLQGLKIHLVKMHPEQVDITCNICKKKFPRKKYCNLHVLKCGFK